MIPALLWGLKCQAFTQSRLEKLIVNGKEATLIPGGQIKLEALDDDVVFYFIGSTDSLVRYRYQLAGEDPDWVYSNYPVSRYTNLEGGSYRFVFQALKNDQLVAASEFGVEVETELTEEWWFIPAVVAYIILLISAAVYFFLLYNFRQKLKMQSLRYNIASDLHDEVGATLSSIAISTRMVQQKVEKGQLDVQPFLEQIRSDSEDTILTIRDTVWAINPDNDSTEKLFEKMRSFAFQLLTAQSIALEFDNRIPAAAMPKMQMGQRRNVYLIFKEAVNNIARHSEATMAGVVISPDADKGITLTITDNGKGFDVNGNFEGNGLKNYRMRAKQGFLDMEVTSGSQGTKIVVKVPEL